MTEKVGYCAVYFPDREGYTRWPIRSNWEHLGEQTLKQVTSHVKDALSGMFPSGSTSYDHAITAVLCDLVIDAADRMNVGIMPCRSYALMKHIGHPCFVVDAGSTTVQSMPVRSWREADEEIDRREMEAGSLPFHLKHDSDGSFQVAIPFDPLDPEIPPGTFRGVLAPLQQHLKELLNVIEPR